MHVISAVRSVQSTDGATVAYRLVHAPEKQQSPSQDLDGQHAVAVATIVMLHGWAQSSASWGQKFLFALAQKHRVIAVDLRGHGLSEVVDSGYDSPTQWADDLDAVLDAEGIDEDSRAILLGWSYGGVVAADFLGQCGTSRIAGLILCSAVTSLGRAPGGSIGSAMVKVVPQAFSDNPRKAIAALGSFGAAMMSVSDGPSQQRMFGLTLATEPFVREAMLNRSVDNSEVLQSLDIPALVLHGTEDGVVLPSAAHANADLIADSSLILLDGVAHAPFVEDQDSVVAAIDDFTKYCNDHQVRAH